MKKLFENYLIKVLPLIAWSVIGLLIAFRGGEEFALSFFDFVNSKEEYQVFYALSGVGYSGMLFAFFHTVIFLVDIVFLFLNKKFKKLKCKSPEESGEK